MSTSRMQVQARHACHPRNSPMYMALADSSCYGGSGNAVRPRVRAKACGAPTESLPAIHVDSDSNFKPRIRSPAESEKSWKRSWRPFGVQIAGTQVFCFWCAPLQVIDPTTMAWKRSPPFGQERRDSCGWLRHSAP